MALDPDFTNGRPYIYVLYTYNKDPADATVPRWADSCPTPPGATGDGCVVSGRLSRLDARGRRDAADHGLVPAVPEPLRRRPRVRPRPRALRLRGRRRVVQLRRLRPGRRAGQPVRRPAGGAAPDPADRRGRRAARQDVRTAGDPTGGDGAILRVDPDTGAALPDNPAAGSADPMTRRIVAHGFRNPFRLTLRPGTGEVWAGDVGWNEWEEVDRVAAPTAGVGNYGWPCYEGAGRMRLVRQPEPEPLRDALRAGRGRARDAALHLPSRRQGRRRRRLPGGRLGDRRAPVLHRHAVPGALSRRRCSSPTTRAAASGSCPGRERAARPGAARERSPRARRDREPDPGAGRRPLLPRPQRRHVQRISYGAPNDAPVAHATATPASGAVPLAVQFDGTTSSDPNGDALTLRVGPRRRRRLRRRHRRAADPHLHGARRRHRAAARDRRRRAAGDRQVTVTAGAPPAARIDTPAAGATWTVGETIAFSGGGDRLAGCGAARLRR